MSPDDHLAPVDAAAILDQVSRRLRHDALLGTAGGGARFYTGGAHASLAVSSSAGDEIAEIALRLQALQSSLDSGFVCAARRIGAAPPRAGSLRGRIGAAAIVTLQRLLWWYTRSLQGFADWLGVQHQSELEVLTALASAQEATRREVAALREELRRVEARLAAAPPGDR
jgi:hypothetical protein